MIALSAGAGLVAILFVAVFGVSEIRLRSVPEIPPGLQTVTSSAEAVERGGHLARTRGCTGCHGDDFAGQILIDVPAFATIAAPNLTAGRGGLPAGHAASDWDRAIRHGVGRDGRLLALMPAHTYAGFGDGDVEALIAYLRSLPTLDRELPPRRFGPVARSLLAAGRLPIFSAAAIDHRAERKVPPAEDATVEFGEYLAAICAGCHGADYSGGRIAGSPPDHPAAPNLTPDPATGIGAWNERDFFTALRHGGRPDGSPISARYMPWEATARMTDVEIRALWLFFSSLPPRASGI